MNAAWDQGPQPERNRALLASVQQLHGRACAGCGRSLCGHDAVMSIVLGYRTSARCASCLGSELSEDATSLAERSLQWVQRRECFLRGWQWASAQEGHGDALRPPCLWPADARSVAAAAHATAEANAAPPHQAEWDAGDLGCGDLVLELRQRLRALPSGTVLWLRASDPGAPEDIPAWCGLTGHALVASAHPEYWIRRKTD
jgi:tRNA 2-thiouridine synthesizing protein A